jgi:hypothetical protein
MSDKVLFVLHAPAEETYATQLAAALSPLPAFPLAAQSGERALQFGAGIICVVVWTPAMAAIGGGAFDPATTIICNIGAKAGIDAFATLNGVGDAGADAVALQTPLAALHALAGGRGSRVRIGDGPRMGATADATLERGKQPFAMKSAYGVAATLAVVGVMAPTIMERAQATGVEPGDMNAEAATMAAVTAEDLAPVAAAQLASAPALSPTPAFDQWVAEPEQEAMREDLFVPAAAPQLALLVAEPFSDIPLDPKRQDYVAPEHGKSQPDKA